MSSDITRNQVRRQLAVMASDYFDLGILRPDGRMLLREAWSSRQIEQAIQQLKRENARGAHIFLRPHGAHALSLVDDLGVEAIARMWDAEFQPALVVETSTRNFQVWLNHRRTLDRSMSSSAAKEIAMRFGGDLCNWVTKYISRGDPPIAQNGFRGSNPWGEWGRRHQCGHGRCAGCWRTGSVAG